MQLGTRWSVGSKPPAAVPNELHGQIAAVEGAITEGQYSSVGVPSWTLTWLEGRPVAELDTGVIVFLGADGVARVRKDDDDEFGAS